MQTLNRRDVALGALALMAQPSLAAAQDAAPFDPSQGPPGLSARDEERLGDHYLQEWMRQRGVDAHSRETQALNTYLTHIGTPLTAHLQRPMHYTFNVDTHPEYVSGFSMPGGRVVIGSGIITLCDSEDALAAVIGHEIMHVDLGHTTMRMAEVQAEQHIPDSRRASIDPGYYGASRTHEQELAADYHGVIAAVGAGYSPYGLRRLFETFNFIFRSYTLPPNALTIDARIAQLDGLIAERGWSNLADAKKPLAMP